MRKETKISEEYKERKDYHKHLNQKYINKLRKNLLQFYTKELGLSDIEKRINKRINRDRGKYYISKLDKVINIKDKKLLDVGSGWGEYVVEAYRKGAIAYGLEPNDDLLEISGLLMNKKGVFKKGFAEKIPFENNFFDIVTCCFVLEHVNKPKKSLQEMIRVLKKNGYLYLVGPNYLYPFEGHYKIRWIPLMPKMLAKIYLRLIGRNPKFIERINYINSWSLFKELKRYEVTIKNLSVEELNKNLDNKPIIKRILTRIIILLHLYSNIELLIRKI